MTTGNVVTDHLQSGLAGGWYGRYSSRVWSGQDRVNIAYLSEPTVWRDMWIRGKLVKFRMPKSTPPRPKRSKDVWHSYSVTRRRQVNGTYFNDISTGTIHPTSGPFVRNATSNSAWTTMPALLNSNDTLRAYADLFNQMKGSEFNLSVFLGEGRDTLHMIGDNAIVLAKSLHHLRRGDITGAARALSVSNRHRGVLGKVTYPPGRLRDLSVKNLSQYWLELQYGWKPLVQDMHDGAKALAYNLTPPFRKSVVTTIERASSWKHTASAAIHVQMEASESIRMEFIATEKPSLAAVLGLQNPASVAWELLPFSFVVDWSIPIGTYLEARNAVSTLVGTYRSTKVSRLKSTHIMQKVPPGDSFSYWGGPYPQASWFEQAKLERSAETSSPKVPSPRIKPLSDVLSFQHCLNGLALLAGAKPPIG